MNNINSVIGYAIDNYSKAAQQITERRKRFCFPITSTQAVELLTTEYKNAVEVRRVNYISDELTAGRLHSIAEWLTNPDCKPSLLICGIMPGTGKTTTARAIAKMADGLKKSLNPNAVIYQRGMDSGEYSPLSVEEERMLSIYENAVLVPRFLTAREIAALAENDKTAFEAVKHGTFLIVDDLGTEPVIIKRFGNEVLPMVELILDRYDGMLPTIFTSNFSLAKISELYGERIGNRLTEMCEILVYSQQESYRR